MTSQEVFDKVAKHLLTQMSRSMTEDHGTNVCVYRADDGKMCAVGAIIPDNVYVDSMEGLMLGELIAFQTHDDCQWTLPDFIIDNKVMLMDLQQMHDNMEAEVWDEALVRNDLESIANHYNLKWSF